MSSDNCTDPPSIAASSVVYNNSLATYSCQTGYSLNGYPTIECVGTEWIGTLPTCEYLIVPNEFDFDHTINFVEEIPTWLSAVVFAVTGVALLLMLTCLLICCMHLCGCYSGPLMGIGGTHVYAENHCAPCRIFTGCCTESEPLSLKPVKEHTRQIELTNVRKDIISESNGKKAPVPDMVRNVNSQTALTIEDDWRPPTPIEPSERGGGRFARTVSELMAKQPKKWSPHSKQS